MFRESQIVLFDVRILARPLPEFQLNLEQLSQELQSVVDERCF